MQSLPIFKPITNNKSKTMKTSYYIEYLNKKTGFKIDREYFTDFEQAKVWGKKNLENFNIDMIRINNN